MWWCHACGEEVDSIEVTYDELHDERFGGCGEDVEWLDEEEI